MNRTFLLRTVHYFSGKKVANIMAVGALALSLGVHAASRIDHADRDFLMEATQAGMTELQASRLALQKSNNPQVREFATHMMQDHVRMGDQVHELALKKSLQLPDSPSLIQEGKLKVLKKMDGRGFDHEYAEMVGVNAHEDAVKLFTRTASEGKDREVKLLAEKALPDLRNHLEMGKKLRDSLVAR